MKRNKSQYTGTMVLLGGFIAYTAFAFFAIQASALPMIEAVKTMA